MKKTFARIALCFAVVCQTVFLVSCSDHADDEKYQSLPPFFSDMTFRSLHGHSTLSAGDSVVVTAVQSRLGRLLYYATYSWGTAYDTDSVTHAYRSVVVYDNDPADPVDTIVFHRPGTYTVTFTARYKMSGSHQLINESETFGSGGKTTVRTVSQQLYEATVQNRVVIRPASN